MERLFRWTFRIVAGLFLLAGLAALSGFWLASRSLPDYARTENVRGLSAPVEIVRNTHNVPHIFRRGRRRDVLRPRLRPCAGPVVADDAPAAHGPGAAVGVVWQSHTSDGRTDPPPRTLPHGDPEHRGSGRRHDGNAARLLRRGQRADRRGEPGGVGTRGPGVLPVLAQHRTVAACRQHRPHQANGAATFRSCRGRSPSRPCVARLVRRTPRGPAPGHPRQRRGGTRFHARSISLVRPPGHTGRPRGSRH